MRAALFAAVAIGVSIAAPAHACLEGADLVLDDVRYADTVVVGRIANYSVIAREKDEFLGPIFEYARFDIMVEEVLKGRAPPVLTATWDNSTFPEPGKIGPPVKYLIALQSPESASVLPLRGPSATVMGLPQPDLPIVLQAPCSEPFIFERGSKDAAGVRRILAQPERPPPREKF
ncbi:MAG TPA: hypothetical protein VGC46_02135 [Allosphingosinicella sp.]